MQLFILPLNMVETFRMGYLLFWLVMFYCLSS
ncbi:hypothetical protein LG58_843 [Kosakonia radicincitans YD4]|nr:hypothetical protein LG58_843 [Kosakonia radicincitans YD4]